MCVCVCVCVRYLWSPYHVLGIPHRWMLPVLKARPIYLSVLEGWEMIPMEPLIYLTDVLQFLCLTSSGQQNGISCSFPASETDYPSLVFLLGRSLGSVP